MPQQGPAPKRLMGMVLVRVPARANHPHRMYGINIPSSARLDDLIDAIYFSIEPFFPPFTYGKTWRLHNKTSGLDIVHAREHAEDPAFGSYASDPRSIEDAGILPGEELEVVFLEP
jgi:hypothetical protein